MKMSTTSFLFLYCKETIFPVVSFPHRRHHQSFIHILSHTAFRGSKRPKEISEKKIAVRRPSRNVIRFS